MEIEIRVEKRATVDDSVFIRSEPDIIVKQDFFEDEHPVFVSVNVEEDTQAVIRLVISLQVVFRKNYGLAKKVVEN